MNISNLSHDTTHSHGNLLEKIEILRSTLRWAAHLERPEIQKLLRQCDAAREEALRLARKERFVQVADHAAVPAVVNPEPAARRQALLARNFVFEGVFGDSPKLLAALEIAERAAPTDLPVLIRGESGTGKELLAKVVHANGARSEAAFISVNCGAIPENLLESELFGHKKGAFTGAVNDRKGKFECADGGTIFLDEIGELPLPGQAKLLRVLQEREIQRVGADTPIQVDARVVAATNRDLRQMVRAGSFREDLYYRLSVIEVTLPALRERRDEIPLLLDFFSGEAATQLRRPPLRYTARLREFLLRYEYPGNIRELRNMVFRLACLADGVADLAQLPEDIRPVLPGQTAEQDCEPLPTKNSLLNVKKTASDEAEKRFLEQTLREVGGKVVELARITGMNRAHLQALLKKHRISARAFKSGQV